MGTRMSILVKAPRAYFVTAPAGAPVDFEADLENHAGAASADRRRGLLPH